uniref:NBAS subunit of NRZ tethering complex n=1 Tax=Stegastes partitus TaxID=144197 RepID=A0A3B5BP03_9TELE
IFPGDFSCAVAGLIFLEYTASAQWSAELLVITHGGGLKSYLVSVGTNQNFQENHAFSFSAHHSGGITSAIYHPGHRLLLVGGCESGDDGTSKASCCGITAWRTLSGSPHYKQVTSYEDDVGTVRTGFFRMPSFRLFSRQGDEKDGVFRMSLSPDGALLAVIHFSGRLSLWDVPSLKQRAAWSQDQQPGFEEINPEWKTSLERRKKIKDKEQYFPLVDVSWWSDNVLILARCSGSVTVSSVRTLRNLLGKSCEWFEPSPRLTAAHDGGFLSLECEVKLAQKRGRLESSLSGGEDEDGDDGGDSDSDEESSAKARYFGYIKQGLYYVTEMERFAPPRKRPRTVTKNYRLVSLRSTTPEELYQRKIDNEEYGEALSLAQAYNLDSDLVYQRQWRKSTVSIASIQDYLSKIRKRSWVLHECVERVPENVDAAKELLQYGLKGTDLEALIAIGNREDGGSFVVLKDSLLTRLYVCVRMFRLTLEQKELCRSRLKLLSYLDRLATYEEILGGPHAAEQKYDAEFFKKFRSQNIVLSARNYARLPRTVLLSDWPRTDMTCPLTAAMATGGVSLGHSRQQWCHVLFRVSVLEQNLFDDDSFLYEDAPELLRFRTASPCIELLTDWYQSRAQDIDSCSRQVGTHRFKLKLVSCNALALPEVLIWKHSSPERYVKDCFQWMVPFLHRCERQKEGAAESLLGEYLVGLARRDLTLPLIIFQHSKPDCQQKIIGDPDQLMSVALDSIYNCERDDQLSLCYDVLECLPQRGYGRETDVTASLHDQVDKLEKHLSVAEVLEKHGLQKPISYVRNSQNSEEEAHQLMVKLCRHTGRNHLVMLFFESLVSLQVSQDVPVSLSFRGKGYALKVSYDSSVDLVLAAAREYFNSSTALTDPCMDLARACLQLISDCPPSVQEELDLISALSQLEDFSVNILPLQVRLRSNRLSLIEECISSCSSAYRQSTTLLSLAALLRVAGDDEAARKGQVLTLLAEQALQNLDFKASYIHCQDVMAAGYGPAWDVCSLLGQCEGYGDLEARQELLAFSLTHCPPDSIHGLLAASSDLQTQVLYQAVNYQMEPVIADAGPDETDSAKASVGSSVGTAGDLLHRTTAKTMEVLTTTGLTTKAVLTAVSDHRWWKESINYLRPLHVRNCCIKSTKSLRSFPPNLLRTRSFCIRMLLQLANDAFPRDMMLALSYLLALPQVLDANRCFEQQRGSALSLQLAAYYYALQIYARLLPCFKDKNHTLYQADPKELIRLVTQHVSSGSDWPEELQKLIGQLQVYNERLTDFTQAQVLQGLGRGVDVHRFSSDGEYKKETILGLTETLDDGVYRIAVSLAKRYSVPLWEVYMTHLEFLFTDSGLSTKDIEARSDSLRLFETLRGDPQAFYGHMTKYVLPTVEGSDLSRLLYYYTLLDAAGCEPFVGAAIKPESHVKLLKKLRAVAGGLNYRKLTDESSDPLAALEPVLTSQNVLSVSKLANRLPRPGAGGATLTSSAVHAVWLQKLFWKGDPQLLKRAPLSEQDFLHAYDTCAKYLDRLLPADAVHFLDSITFSPDAAEQLSVQTRSEVIKRATKALRQLAEKSRRRDGGAEQDASDPAGMTFDEALTHLQQSQAHLDSLSHSFIQSLRDSQQEQHRRYGRLYDLSRSDRAGVCRLAVTMATDGQPLDLIGQLLSVAVGPSDLSVRTVLQEAVENVVAALSGDPAALTNYPQPLGVLEAMVTAVHNNVQTGDSAVTSDDLLAWLRPFCGDASLPVRPRIDVLQILEGNFSLRDADVLLLLLYRTQAVLKDREVQIEDVENEDKRYDLFQELLEAAQKWEDFQLLMLLLQAWPPMMKQERNPWVLLALALLTRCQGSEVDLGQQVVAMVRSLYGTKHKLPAQAVPPPAGSLNSSSSCLLQDSASRCDGELLSLLLDAGLLVGCVASPLYPPLSLHLLQHQQDGGWDVEAAAARLAEAGHRAEAGSLLLAHRGAHPGLTTFTSALAVLKKWL